MSGNKILVSVNVGTPRTVQWRGRTLRTSIFKTPVNGPVRVEGVSVRGDDQADRENHGGHDKAVYAYAREDYDWWMRELGVPLEPGRFGENLTTGGLDVGEALVGERWRVGSALLEVSSPRIPCSKLAMRLDDPEFVKRFAEALRPGAYLRIIEPGEIAAHDPIAVEFRPEHPLSVRELAKIYFREHGRVKELLAVAELGPGWHAWAEQRLAAQAG